MKVRMTIAKTGLSARLFAVGCGMTILASGAVSACSGSTPTAEPTSSTFSPGAGVSPTARVAPTGTATATPTGTATATSKAKAGGSPSPSHSHSASPSPSPQHHHSPSPVPAAAPATGGGGTAGFQDTLLLTVGGAAVVIGAGSLAYRRRVLKQR